MRFIHLDKSSIFLILIILVVVGVVLGGLLYFRGDAVDEALKNDRIIKVLFVIEDKGKPLATEVLFFYPASKRAAVFDIPEDTGQLVKSLGRVDRIDAVFKPKDSRAYRVEVEKLLGTDVPMSVVLSLDQLGRVTDLLGGLELFIPNSVEILDANPAILFPQGTAFFDGDKVMSYVSYEDPGESDTDLVNRRQKCFIALLKRISERSEYLRKSAVMGAFASGMETNLDGPALKGLVTLMEKLDAELISPTRVQGKRKDVEGSILLFPAENGGLLKEIVKQNLNALVAAAETSEGDRVFTLEILNGTSVNQLAQKAADLYESFGYDVLTVGNAATETKEKTVVYDRISNDRMSTNIAAIIRAPMIEKVGDNPPSDNDAVDFTIILGKDFDGRYCAP
jgi:anionic cell wall polymer biosynthesis LytR-Cps2A-Psr (LCP) family protein